MKTNASIKLKKVSTISLTTNDNVQVYSLYTVAALWDIEPLSWIVHCIEDYAGLKLCLQIYNHFIDFVNLILAITIIFPLLQVDLCRSFTFRNSGQTYDGVPVMAANMDTVGTFEMAKSFARVSSLSEQKNHYEATSDNLSI